MSPYTIVGIDSSIANMGLAAVTWFARDAPTLIGAATIKTKPAPKKRRPYEADDTSRRVLELVAELDRFNVGLEFNARLAVVEAPRGSKSMKAARGMAIAWAVAVVWCHERNLPLMQVRAVETKEAVCGKAGASKAEVAAAVAGRVNLRNHELTEHEADAVAAVLTVSTEPTVAGAIAAALES